MSDDLAERVRRTCLDVILEAYEAAGAQGLCAEGRWEAAVGALRALDLAPIVSSPSIPVEDSSPPPGSE